MNFGNFAVSQFVLPDAFTQEFSQALAAGHRGEWQVPDLAPVILEGPPCRDVLLLAHGAGAGHDSPFLLEWRAALARAGVQTLSFEFAYLREMRAAGRRRPPPRVARLVEEMRLWRDVLSQMVPGALWLGGKSMGGRVASLLAAEDGAPGLVLAGYPFHPVGKPERLRLDHWPSLACPLVVLQGTRDPFGTRDEVAGYELPAHARLEWLEDGDHDWSPRRLSGLSRQDLMAKAARATVDAMRKS